MAADYPWMVDGHLPSYLCDPPADGRRVVVASGSNASPTVMAHKLGHPFTLYAVGVRGIAVGHSAHVARRGYIPAAPFRRERHTLRTSAALLDAAELAALDATEPNYHRVTVRTNDIPLLLGSTPATAPATPPDFDLYVSRFGVLGDLTEGPLEFTSQHAVFGWLDERVPGYALTDPADRVCTRLADPSTGQALTAAMGAAGFALSDDLDLVATGSVR